MIPGMNPRMMKQAMKKLGIQQVEIDANEVIIKTDDKDIIIQEPSVTKVNMSGQETFQIVGQVIERERQIDISDDDVKTVVEQTNVSQDVAKETIKKHEGDLAAAIMELKED